MDDKQKKDDKPNKGNETPKQEPAWVERAFLKTRTVFLTGEINDEKASAVCRQVLALAFEASDPITLIISSPGGHVESGYMVYDMLRFVTPKAPARVLGTGWVASAAALIFIGVPPEQRFCFENTRFMIHQPTGSIGGQASDMYIQANEIQRMHERLTRIFSEGTGQSQERIAKDTHRDFWMDAQAAKEYGLVKHIIQTADQIY